ncbi:MAG: efflux RND transporter periplasmic adaptor subunit [Verrucomicrobiae bacterium]|nr:efflux RND transporter periplasmic adaptor subunit [Verrucomicrobiae bacterium]
MLLLLKRPSFYLAVLGIVATAFLMVKMREEPPVAPPLVEPARSPYQAAVAGVGMVEAMNENVKLAPSVAGVVSEVAVKVGQRVEQGELLFKIDDRETVARLVLARSQLKSTQAALKTEQVALADAKDRWERAERLAKEKVVSEDEKLRRYFEQQEAEARVARLEADVEAAQAEIQKIGVELELHEVRAPRDGRVLQVNVRAGEFAGTNPEEPMAILGNVEDLQVRVDVDEQNALLVQPNAPATAYLRGIASGPLPLKFVRIEPYVVPKRSLTGDTMERVDTRVLQVIYQFDPPATNVYVGQLVDVYIKREPSG